MNSVAETSALFPALVCPKDQQPLNEGRAAMTCPAGHGYAVRDGIPRVVSTDLASCGRLWRAMEQVPDDPA